MAEWHAALNRAQNFLKHANRDPDDALDFRPDLVKFLIFEAVLVHRALTAVFLPETVAFCGWFSATHPQLVKDGPIKARAERLLAEGVDVSFEQMLMAIDHLRAECGERLAAGGQPRDDWQSDVRSRGRAG